MLTKAKLAIILSQLQLFEKPTAKLEQYPTDSEIAADILWQAYMLGDIAQQRIADLGCGTGILGIGALLLDAEFVYFIDYDRDALILLQQNLKKLRLPTSKYKIINKNVTALTATEATEITTTVILQNPPFGTKQKHNDKLFLEAAFSVAPVIYSFHKTNTKRFIEAIATDYNYKITHELKTSFPLKKTMKFHKSRIKRIEVTCFRLVK